MTQDCVFCAGIGPRIVVHAVDTDAFTLEPRTEIDLPGGVQYACQSPQTGLFYAAVSDGGPRIAGSTHHIHAFHVDAAKTTLVPHGKPAPLRSRPVHISIDPQGRHLLVAYHKPAGLSVHRLNADGTVGDEVPQDPDPDTGIYPHHIMVSPDGSMAVLSARGNDAKDGKPEEPGALKVFRYDDGRLRFRSSIAPNGGHGFGPRNIAFHKTKPWVYVALERQNKLHVFEIADGTIKADPLFVRETMKDPGTLFHKQVVGAIGLHPSGEVLYVVNRGGPHNPLEVHLGGENAIAVYRLNLETGEPELIQHADTRGNRPRTFSMDPGLRMMVAGNMQQRLLKDGDAESVIPPGLAVLAVRSDGTLDFRRRYDVDTGKDSLFWSGFARAV